MILTSRGAQRVVSSRRPRRAARVLALMLVTVTVVTGCAASVPADDAPTVTAPSRAAEPPQSDAPPAASAETVPAAPTRVVLPKLGLDEPLIELGLAADGAMEVPTDYDDVGWFTGGGRPGGTGPTVIAGHVDSPTGPAVFLRLNEMSVGDVVEVHDSEGNVHAYRVTETADYPKAAFPTARVFGATSRDELRLITCGGVFDRDAGSYVDNRVVFAERV